MENDNGIRECENCHHDIIMEGKSWIHITSSISGGKGGFNNKGKPEHKCPICGCDSPEPKIEKE